METSRIFSNGLPFDSEPGPMMSNGQDRRSAAPIVGAFNFRDLGGIRTASGRVVRKGRLFRSDTPQALTQADLAWLTGTVGLAGVVDLRLAEEATAEGRGLLELAAGVAYVNVPMQMASLDGIEPADVLDALYMACLAPGSGLPRAVEYVAGFIEGPTLFHCAAGKDRTGLLAAVILAAVGVAEDAIVADYLLSGGNMPRMLERFATWPRYRDHLQAMPPQVYAVEEAPIRRFLQEIDVRHGGVRGWALENGIRKEVLARLERELVTDH